MKPFQFTKARILTFLFPLIGISLFMIGSGLCILLFLIGGTLSEWIQALARPIIFSLILGVVFGLMIKSAMPNISPNNEKLSKIEMREMTITLLKVFAAIYMLFGGWGLVAFWRSNPEPLGEFIFFSIQFGVGLLTCCCTLFVLVKTRNAT